MGEFSLPHLLIVAVILLVIFGPSRLPGLGQSMGKAIRGFKEGLNVDDEPKGDAKAKPETPAAQTSFNLHPGAPASDPVPVPDPAKRGEGHS